MKNKCVRCVELSQDEEVEGTNFCTVTMLITNRIRDLYLCNVCMKYMKKLGKLIKVYDSNEKTIIFYRQE